MQARAALRRSGILGRGIVALLVAFAMLPAVGVAAPPFIVDTLTDGVGADSDGMRTFRWALSAANADTSGTPITIKFAPNLKDAAGVLIPLAGLADANGAIRIELNLTPAAIIEITNELTIEGNTSATGGPFFFDIVRTDASGNPGLAFLTRENLTLMNVDLRSSALVGNRNDTSGPATTGATIDLIYDIDSFEVDVTGQIKEFYFDNPRGDKARLIKKGTGELALLSEIVDPDAYTGGTVLEAGVLRTDARSLQGDIQICADTPDPADCADALLIFEMPSVVLNGPDPRTLPIPVDGTFGGDISSTGLNPGDGKVVKTGIGSLTLTGNNSYTGGTYILAGEVIGDTNAIQGDVHICPGVANLNKPNDPTGSSPLSCDLTSQAQLTFDIATDSTFAGTLLGQGIVKKTGDAKLSFDNTNTQSDFDGTLQIDQGELVIDTALAGGVPPLASLPTAVEVTVNSGGTLSGSGTLNGDVTVEAGGVIKGGLTLATNLLLRGTLDLASGSMTSTDATFDNNSVVAFRVGSSTGHLTVRNLLTLNAFSLAVTIDPGFTTGKTSGEQNSFTLASSSMIAGTLPGGLNLDSAIFGLVFAKDDANCGMTPNLCITSTFDPSLQDDAITQNQKLIATAIERAFDCAQNPSSCSIDPSVAADFNSLFGNFAVPTSQIPDILDQLAGDEYSAFSDLRSASAARFNRSISRRFDLEFTGDPKTDSATSNDPLTEATAGDVSAPAPEWKTLGGEARIHTNYRDFRSARLAQRRQRHGGKEAMPIARHIGKGGFTGWLDIHGVTGNLSGSKNAKNIDYRIYGPLLGLDYGISEHITLGITLGYTRNQLSTPGSTTRGTGNTYQGGAYVGAMFDSFHIVGAARYAYSQFSTRRKIRFNTLNRAATADFTARDTSGFLEAAYHIRMGDHMIIQPMISFAYNHLNQDSFNESGASSLNLQVDRQVLNTGQSSMGLRFALFGHDAEQHYLLPQLRLAYEREWLDKNRSVSANLPSAGPNGAFKLSGLALPRDRAVVGLSSEVGISDRVNLFVDYDLRAASNLLEHSLAFGFRAIW